MSNKISLDDVVDFMNRNMQNFVYFLLLIIVIINIIVYLQHRTERKIEKYMTEYYKVIKNTEQDKSKSIRTLTDIYNSNVDVNVKMIVGMRLAELKGRDDAIKIYLEIYNTFKNDDFIRNMAGLNALNIMIDTKKDNKEIEKLLSGLKNPNNPVLNLVMEQQAIFEFQRGNKEEFVQILNEILKQDNIDNYLKERVNSLLELQ